MVEFAVLAAHDITLRHGIRAVAIMLGGRIVATVPSEQLSRDEALQRRYLGVSTAGR